MIVGTHQHVEIDDIHEPYLDARHVLLQQPGCGTSFNSRNIASTCQNNIRFRSTIIRCKFPDRCSLGAVSESFVECKPLQFRLLSASNNVDVVSAAQAMIEYVEQAVRIRWVVDSNDLGSALKRVVDKTWRLVAEPIVVVPPSVAREQHIQRGKRPAPRIFQALLHP